MILERPHRLAFAFRTNISANSTLAPIDIQPAQAVCDLTLTMRMLFKAGEERGQVVRVYGAVEGAKQAFKRLDGFLAER